MEKPPTKGYRHLQNNDNCELPAATTLFVGIRLHPAALRAKNSSQCHPQRHYVILVLNMHNKIQQIRSQNTWKETQNTHIHTQCDTQHLKYMKYMNTWETSFQSSKKAWKNHARHHGGRVEKEENTHRYISIRMLTCPGVMTHNHIHLYKCSCYATQL